ncbi:MAG: hypothetical protein WC359_15250 [Dehalococcoidia bacterium]|jgi:hypothetical protein
MALDLLGRILQIMSKDGNLTFDRTTDSLEAISDSLGDVAGLAYYGVVTAVPAANQFTVDGLSGYGETAFVGWTSFIFWDAGGGGAAPQGESQIVTAYVTATGTFTAPAYTAPVAVGDKVILLHPLVATITEIYPDGAVWFDEFSGITGTAYPYGTPEFPVNSEADARTIAIANNLNKIAIAGEFIVPAAMEGYAFIGTGRYNADDTVNFNGQDVDSCSFHRCSITGANGGTGMITTYDGFLVNPTNLAGAFFRGLIQACTIQAGATAVDFHNCAGWQGSATITVGTPNPLNVFEWTGSLILDAQTGGVTNVYLSGGSVTINVTCVGGAINLYGVGNITDNSGGATVNDYTLNTALGLRDVAAGAGIVDTTTNALAYLKQVAKQSMNLLADVTTYTDANNFASTDLVGYENDFFVGWYVFVARDDGGASAAPQGEYRLITDYVSATGTITHNAFSAILAVGDQVMLIHPMLYEILTIRGGAETLESLDDELDAMLDLAEEPTNSVTCDGTTQTIYERTGESHPFYFAGGYIDFTGANFGAGEDTTITVDVRVDGTNYRTIYTETFLAAALPSPVAVPFPRDANTDVQPKGFYSKQDVKVTITQAAVGAGWNTLPYRIIDGVRGS